MRIIGTGKNIYISNFVVGVVHLQKHPPIQDLHIDIKERRQFPSCFAFNTSSSLLRTKYNRLTFDSTTFLENLDRVKME
ncbi:MAG: hypothetical protein ABF321_02555, partial [Bacteroidia bacterium]